LAAAKEGSLRETKAVFESILAGVVLAIFSYAALISRATLAAIAIRHKMPDAWFAGLITWYAMFVVLGVSLVVGGVTCRFVHKHQAGQPHDGER
jgi:predicted phage tail protein